MTAEELYDATRKEWRIKIDHAIRVEYVFALYDNTVVEVYKPLEWYVHTSNGRLMFEGELANLEIRQKYLGMHMSKLEGLRNPAIYNF